MEYIGVVLKIPFGQLLQPFLAKQALLVKFVEFGSVVECITCVVDALFTVKDLETDARNRMEGVEKLESSSI